jgi:nitrite reductase/ring-hydroxylating ferredoxin subunit
VSQVEETKLDLALICAENDVPEEGALLTRTVKGKRVVLSRSKRSETGIVAFNNRCPHMSGPLGYGRVVDGQVICPWHFFRFDTVTGETIACESMMKLEVYRVKVIGGNVYVEL